MKLLCSALIKVTLGILLVGVLVFLPAGTLAYLQGWLFMGLLFLMMPLVLGSWYAAIIFLTYPVLIILRLKGEEDLLVKELPGYGEYRKKVKYRLIPFIW